MIAFELTTSKSDCQKSQTPFQNYWRGSDPLTPNLGGRSYVGSPRAEESEAFGVKLA